MTKTKAFFICLGTPIAVIFLIKWLLPNEGGENLASAVRGLLFIPLVPISLFVPAYSINKEFRKYGLYGALMSIFVLAIISMANGWMVS